ncbi:TPA: hypothetical protein RQK90_004436 [Vibrio vulnificus]|nr:hypothetical protein [Vibrio vulnificus]
MNKKTIALALSAALVGFSSVAIAAPTTGNLNFTFSGNIPALPSSGDGWTFVQADGTPYVAPSSISLSSQDTADGVQLISTSETFYIKPDSGNFTASSKITAMLTSNPAISGTAVKAGKAGDVEMVVTINGVTVPVGTSADVATPVNGDPVSLSLGTVIDIPSDARTAEGGVLTVSVPIRFSADIGA